GVDLFLEKPNTSQEINFFLDCIESLLGQEEQSGGFRGVQSKSLVDIIQLECLSGSSSILKITNGVMEGRIWINDGEIIDAQTHDLNGAEAFQHIFSWRTGNFEIQPPEPQHERKIFESYQGLLLSSSQAIDENKEAGPGGGAGAGGTTAAKSPLANLAQFSGVEFVLTAAHGDKGKVTSYGLEDAEKTGVWVRQTAQAFRVLGDSLRAGELRRVEGVGSQNHLSIAPGKEADLCAGFHRSLSQDLVRETMKKIVTRWAS
ncbi:MAG TPA: DUF4388 domain-containing protein, partial [Verrucomicrobiae bacterium]|nr:DUF4388 domain-containing protein [Verrucomicrobiae bacterium]